MSHRKTAIKAAIEARNASSWTGARPVRSTCTTRPMGNSNHTAVKSNHPKGSGLRGDASVIPADTPAAGLVGCSLSVACAILVGSCANPIIVSMRGITTPPSQDRSTSRHVSPLQREARHHGEDDGVGCEHERRLGPVHDGVHPWRVVSSAQSRDERPRVHPGQELLQLISEVKECCGYVHDQ